MMPQYYSVDNFMQQSEILALAGLRLDGRRYNEIRTIKSKFGVMASADGSVYFELGLNKVLVSIHGPREPVKKSDVTRTDNGFITCQLMITPFSGNERKKRKMGDRRSQEIETIVKNTFESVILLDLYQQSEIIIVVHVFESDGSLICSILNATTLAMIDAGINMKDMVASCSVGVFKQLIYKDVTQTEQISGSAYIPVATQGLNKGILYIQLDSRISLDLLETAVEKAIEGCSEIHLALAEITKAHIIAIDSS